MAAEKDLEPTITYEPEPCPTFVPGRVGIVGLGLMGGSFAKAMHEGGREVYAWNRTRSTLELAMIETVDDRTIPTCELIILAGYPQFSIDWLADMADKISGGAIVIDAVGVKRVICERCFDIAKGRDWTFVGCHPMAGTQYSGYGHSRANMFHRAPMVVVPPQMEDIKRLDLLDRLKGFSAGSYKDLTRVARLNAPMWTELFLDNADYLSDEVGTLIENLRAYKDALDARDADRLEALLAEGDRLKREAEAR